MLNVMGSPEEHNLRSKTNPSFSPDGEQKPRSERKRLLDVLSELRNLLEDYSPIWYTEEQHRRVELALDASKQY